MVLNDLTISTCCKTGLGPSLYICITFDPVEFHPDHLDFWGIQWKRHKTYTIAEENYLMQFSYKLPNI